MKKFAIVFIFFQLIYAERPREFCKTEPMAPDQILEIKRGVEDWLANQTRDPVPVHILVAWHVIYSSSGTGNVSDNAIYSCIDWLNETFLQHSISFTLESIDRTENNEWFNDWYGNSAWPGMQELAIDPNHYMNIYSANLYAGGAAGWSYLGDGFGPSDYRQSVNLDYRELAYGNDTGTHEVGHHLGLPHTFESDCNGPDDGIDDTPRNHSDYLWTCNDNLDSCPNDEGNDPVHNYMTYSSSSCTYEFTQGQEDWMHYVIENNHPGYLQNDFLYPDLYLNTLTYQADSDGDGVFNPGDSVRVRCNIGNNWGADAEDVVLTLTSNDDRLVILDNTIQFQNVIEAGQVSFTLFDWFEVYAYPDASLGTILCNLNMATSNEENPYEINVELALEVSLNQYGFPIEGIPIKSSPVIFDLDGDLNYEIFAGSDNGNLYGYMNTGSLISGFPFSAIHDIRSSPAIKDIDLDGVNDIIFGALNGNMYVLDSYGEQKLAYGQPGLIMGSPAIVDLDVDGDYEIVFTTNENGNSGRVYAIHHDGTDVNGFPLDLGEKMMVGAAAGDLDLDGYADIVVGTWDDNIYAIDHQGLIKPGFPYISSNRFNAPATLVDLDGDGDLEIIAGNDSGLLHVLHHDGTQMTSYEVGDAIRGGISVADLNDDGSYELLFSGWDELIHVLNPLTGEELNGWPVSMGTISFTEPLTADLDNDGDLEIITAMYSGTAYVLHHDGTPFNGFPLDLNANIESTPAIGDLDGDNDYEIVFGTTYGLQVFDIKTEGGDRVSWKLYRGNLERTGSLAMTLVSVKSEDFITPDQFYVSPNYPNPFNPSTQVTIQTAEKNNLAVNIFDATGRLINTLIDKNLDAGIYNVKWNGRDIRGYEISAGMYFIRVQSGSEIRTQKMILLK